jgi:hypothetical protein
LDKVLSIMEAPSIYAKESKCEFGMTELLYLGHIISAQGVQVHQEKIRAILDRSTSRNVTELRSFFGLCNFLSPSLGITKEIMSRGPQVLDMEHREPY